MAIDLLEVARLRLRNQRVTGEHCQKPADVVSWLGCVQSQETALAKWSIGMRLAGRPRENDVDEALSRGEVIRTHILRPTWHYVLPADIRWIMRLTAPRVLAASAGRMRQLELDAKQIAQASDVMARALEGNKNLTRLELQAALEKAGLHPDGQRVAYMVMAAEKALVLGSGPSRDGKQTYALLDEFAPPSAADKQPFDRDAALAKLTIRYFTSHGPATIRDLVWWSSLTTADVKRGIDMNGPALERLDVGGEQFWWAGDRGGRADSPASPTVHLMQAYDEYVVAYRSPRTPINVAGLASASVLQRPPFYHAIFVDTQLVGFWRRLTARSGFTIDRVMLRALTSAEDEALRAEVGRYAEFVGRRVELI
ncbi:MAG TPA: winged helix DNA-binding domain-containing protein [Candidatus Limnocylindrales bacterium]